MCATKIAADPYKTLFPFPRPIRIFLISTQQHAKASELGFTQLGVSELVIDGLPYSASLNQAI